MYNYHVTVTNICVCAIKTHPTIVTERQPNDQIPKKKALLKSVRLISYTTVKFLTNIILTEKCFFRNGFDCEHAGASLHSMHDYILFSQSTLSGGNKG